MTTFWIRSEGTVCALTTCWLNIHILNFEFVSSNEFLIKVRILPWIFCSHWIHIFKYLFKWLSMIVNAYQTSLCIISLVSLQCVSIQCVSLQCVSPQCVSLQCINLSKHMNIGLKCSPSLLECLSVRFKSVFLFFAKLIKIDVSMR